MSDKSPPGPLVQNLIADRAVVASSIGTVVMHAPPSRWSEIDFSEQEDLRAALSGASLGPQHVDACPPIKEAADIVEALRAHRAVAVVGESGTGKSMAAWHAAHRMSRAGWSVYLLASAYGADFPPDDRPVLLMVDDVQAYPAPPVFPAVATGSRLILVVSNQPVPGFRTTVRIAANRAVADVADGLLERQDALLPLLQDFDTHVGERSLDVSVRQKVLGAKEASKALWQFMFNLGSGYLRMRGPLEDVLAVPHCARILFLIAARQLASMNLGVPIEWLRQRLANEEGPLEVVLDEIHARVPLVRTPGSAAMPHPLVASRVVKALFYGDHSGERIELFWALFDDDSVPLQGLAWLIRESPDYLAVGMGVPGALPGRLVVRCVQSHDVRGAADTLAHLLSWWRLPGGVVRPHLALLANWLSHPHPDDGYALHRLLNNLYNTDNDIARELVAIVDPAVVAEWLNEATVSSAAPLSAVLDRLLLGATDAWRATLADRLDRQGFLSLAGAFGPDEAWEAAQVIFAVGGVDHDTAMGMARAHLPALVRRMELSILDAFSASHDLIWNVLGFAPHFLRGGYEPVAEAHALARELVEKIGAATIASQMASARRRDWQHWGEFSGFMREVAPEVACAVGEALAMDAVLAEVARYADDRHDVDQVLVALALGHSYEPAARVVRELLAPKGVLSWRAAVIAPDAALMVARRRGEISLALGGGLPNWKTGTLVIALIADADLDAARWVAESNLKDLSDGLAYRQANGGDGALGFLDVAERACPDTLRRAVAGVDVSAARSHWPDRLVGSTEERAVVGRLLVLARDVGGEIADFARDLATRQHARPAKGES